MVPRTSTCLADPTLGFGARDLLSLRECLVVTLSWTLGASSPFSSHGIVTRPGKEESSRVLKSACILVLNAKSEV